VGTLGKAFGSFGAFVAGSAELIELLMQKARSYIYTTALPQPVAAASRKALEIAQRETWRRERVLALAARFRSAAGQLGVPLLTTGVGTTGTALTGIVAVGTRPTGAALTRTALTRTALTGAALTGAALTGTALTGTALTGTALTGTAPAGTAPAPTRAAQPLTPIQPVLLGTSEAALHAQHHLHAAGFCVVAIRPPTVPQGSARLRVTLSAAHTEAQVDELVETLSRFCAAQNMVS
jgi:7-keto-8-aminopelargonate synthetase-like enzyme